MENNKFEPTKQNVNANPSPILSSRTGRDIDFFNAAVTKIMEDLGCSEINDMLPTDHVGLVKACLRTKMTLTGECECSGHYLVWRYQPSENGEVAFIYGHDVSECIKK